MRLSGAWALVVLVALSGCLQSESRAEGPGDCLAFCSENEQRDVTILWMGPLVALLLLALLVGIVIAAVAGRDGQQQQQQVVVHVEGDAEVRQR